jgi:hypothetical protein
MKAISLWQPWASLVAEGFKKMETRDWPPPRELVGQRIAIHATQKIVPWLELTPAFRHRLEAHLGPGIAELWCDRVPRGAIVCTAILGPVLRVETVVGGWAFCRVEYGMAKEPVRVPVDPFGNFAPERVLWPLLKIERLPAPAPCRAHQRFFQWDPSASGVQP